MHGLVGGHVLAGRGRKSESALFKMLDLPLVCIVTAGKSTSGSLSPPIKCM